MNLIWFVLKILSSQAVRFGDIKASFLLTYIDSNWHRRKYIRDIILTFNIRRRKPATDREHRSESLRFKILSSRGLPSSDAVSCLLELLKTH